MAGEGDPKACADGVVGHEVEAAAVSGDKLLADEESQPEPALARGAAEGLEDHRSHVRRNGWCGIVHLEDHNQSVGAVHMDIDVSAVPDGVAELIRDDRLEPVRAHVPAVSPCAA